MTANTTVWVAFAAAIMAAIVVAVSGFVLHFLDRRAQRKHEILQERKEALFDALQVIDLVYAHEPLLGKEPLNPKEWDISLARNTMNKMLIYCENPQRTVQAFYKAIGLYNPHVNRSSPGVDLKYLDEFRKEVAHELNLPEPGFVDPNKAWIYSLAGTAEAKKLESHDSL